MKITISNLVTFVTVGVATLATTSIACAGGGNKGGGGFGFGYSKGGFSVGVGLGGGHSHHSNLHHKKHNDCQYNGGFNGPYSTNPLYEPFHSYYICQPGDTFYAVSLKEYRTSGAARYIAQFNRLPFNTALVPGQRLLLPSVSPSGRLTQSRAPAPFIDATPTAKATSPVTSNFASSTKPVETEPALPKVSVGSTLLVDGQVFGEEAGVARLRISGVSLPIEVLEWTNSSTKIRLPELEVTSATKAEIEILRADGSLASKSGIELTPAETKLALGN